MSHALQALLLIRLDARAGELVGVDELADHYGISPDHVRAELERMWQLHQVQTEREGAGTADAGVIVGASVPARGDRA